MIKRTSKEIKVAINNGTLVDTTNKTKLFELFSKRDLYSTIFDDYNVNNIETINLWTERTLYGKIDHEQQPVLPIYTKLKTLINSNNNSCFVVAPVADAFLDLNNSMNYDSNIRKIKPSSYYPLRPKSATYNVVDKMNTQIIELFDFYYTRYVKLYNKKNMIKSFEDFINYSLEFLNISNPFITLSSFSLKQNYLSNGLTIDLVSDKDASSDKEKQINYLEDENFTYFLDKAEQFGFFVDKNVPWRLVFNIQSPNSQKYLQKYNISNTKQFFETFYVRTILLELDLIKQQYVRTYNQFLRINPDVLNSCNKKIQPRTLITDQILNDDYRWLKFHYFLKLKEFNLIKDQNNYDQLISDFNMLYGLNKDILIKHIQEVTKPVVANGANPDLDMLNLTTKKLSYKINYKF